MLFIWEGEIVKEQIIFIFIGCLFFVVIGLIVYFGNNYNLNNIKSKTVEYGRLSTAYKVIFMRDKWQKEIHLLMIDVAGIGKTAHFLYPNLEYDCAFYYNGYERRALP